MIIFKAEQSDLRLLVEAVSDRSRIPIGRGVTKEVSAPQGKQGLQRRLMKFLVKPVGTEAKNLFTKKSLQGYFWGLGLILGGFRTFLRKQCSVTCKMERGFECNAAFCIA